MKTRTLIINGQQHHLRRDGAHTTLFAFGSPKEPFRAVHDAVHPTVRAAKAFMNNPAF